MGEALSDAVDELIVLLHSGAPPHDSFYELLTGTTESLTHYLKGHSREDDCDYKSPITKLLLLYADLMGPKLLPLVPLSVFESFSPLIDEIRRNEERIKKAQDSLLPRYTFTKQFTALLTSLLEGILEGKEKVENAVGIFCYVLDAEVVSVNEVKRMLCGPLHQPLLRTILGQIDNDVLRGLPKLEPPAADLVLEWREEPSDGEERKHLLCCEVQGRGEGEATHVLEPWCPPPSYALSWHVLSWLSNHVEECVAGDYTSDLVDFTLEVGSVLGVRTEPVLRRQLELLQKVELTMDSSTSSEQRLLQVRAQVADYQEKVHIMEKMSTACRTFSPLLNDPQQKGEIKCSEEGDSATTHTATATISTSFRQLLNQRRPSGLPLRTRLVLAGEGQLSAKTLRHLMEDLKAQYQTLLALKREEASHLERDSVEEVLYRKGLEVGVLRRICLEMKEEVSVRQPTDFQQLHETLSDYVARATQNVENELGTIPLKNSSHVRDKIVKNNLQTSDFVTSKLKDHVLLYEGVTEFPTGSS